MGRARVTGAGKCGFVLGFGWGVQFLAVDALGGIIVGRFTGDVAGVGLSPVQLGQPVVDGVAAASGLRGCLNALLDGDRRAEFDRDAW
jgi:hypothetical protein